jgi:hypothetical protein
MTIINLRAETDFQTGEAGRMSQQTVTKIVGGEKGVGTVIATQPVKAGTNGWFEAHE